MLLRDKKAAELKGVFYNEQSLYRSARRLRDFGLLNYNAGLFSLTFKGIILAHIIDDVVKVDAKGVITMKEDKTIKDITEAQHVA
jgi:hypothetical protein